MNQPDARRSHTRVVSTRKRRISAALETVVDAECTKRSLCLEEPAAAISAPGLASVGKQSCDRMNVQAADWDESRSANVVNAVETKDVSLAPGGRWQRGRAGIQGTHYCQFTVTDETKADIRASVFLFEGVDPIVVMVAE